MGQKVIIRFWWESGLSSTSKNHLTTLCRPFVYHACFKSVVLKVVDIDPHGSIGPSKRSINSQGVEWGSMNGQGVNEKLLRSTGDMKPPIQCYC